MFASKVDGGGGLIGGGSGVSTNPGKMMMSSGASGSGGGGLGMTTKILNRFFPDIEDHCLAACRRRSQI